MFLFCPRCHRRVGLPKGLEKANIKGNLNITCCFCKKGKIVFKGEPEHVIENPRPIEEEWAEEEQADAARKTTQEEV